MKTEVSDIPLSSVAAFDSLSREACIDLWRRQIGGQPLKYVSLQFMRSALAYEAQIKVHGGHSAAVRKALKAVTQHAKLTPCWG